MSPKALSRLRNRHKQKSKAPARSQNVRRAICVKEQIYLDDFCLNPKHRHLQSLVTRYQAPPSVCKQTPHKRTHCKQKKKLPAHTQRCPWQKKAGAIEGSRRLRRKRACSDGFLSSLANEMTFLGTKQMVSRCEKPRAQSRPRSLQNKITQMLKEVSARAHATTR